MLLRESIYTSLLITLNDIIKSLDKKQKNAINKNINNDLPSDSKCKSIEGLIRKHRDAACHITTTHLTKIKDDGEVIFSFNLVKGPKAIKVGNKHFGCDYNDDLAIFYGPYRVYLKRHIRKLLELLKSPDSLVPSKKG